MHHPGCASLHAASSPAAAAAGRVPGAIVSAAVDFQADLIIVGRSPEWTLTRLMTRNISQGVVRLAPMPVLVVPAGSPEREHKSLRCQSRPGEWHPSAAPP